MSTKNQLILCVCVAAAAVALYSNNLANGAAAEGAVLGSQNGATNASGTIKCSYKKNKIATGKRSARLDVKCACKVDVYMQLDDRKSYIARDKKTVQRHITLAARTGLYIKTKGGSGSCTWSY